MRLGAKEGGPYARGYGPGMSWAGETGTPYGLLPQGLAPVDFLAHDVPWVDLLASRWRFFRLLVALSFDVDENALPEMEAQ